MEIMKEFGSALIGGGFGILGSFIGFFVLKYQLKKNFDFDIKKLEKTFEIDLKQEVFKTKYDHDKRLLEERLKYYPKLFDITQEIGKSSKKRSTGKEELSAENIIKIIQDAEKEILEWRKSVGFLILKKNSLEAFNDLKEAITTSPGNGKQGYTKEQLSKIWKLRNSLRGSLKDDIGIKIEDYRD